MISINGFKRKSSTDNHNPIITTTTKRFRGTAYDGKIQTNEQLFSTQSKMITSEYRQLQYELQCQEALLILMQKLKTNQRIVSQTNNTKQRTITPVNTVKSPTITSTKSSSNSTSIKPSSTIQPSASKVSVPLPQATRQTNNSTLPATATRLSTTVPSTTTKNSSNTSSKNNGITTDQHLLNAKLALRKQLEQTLLQIPTPKPTTCDLPYIPGINGWAEFLTLIGLEQAFNTYTDFVNRRLIPDISINTPNICAQCGTDWSVTWHEVISINESDKEEKIFCDRCRKTSQKKILKQDHSNRLRQAFMKALQQEKELDAKFQQTAVKQQPQPTPQPPPPPPPPSSSHSKHSNKPLSTKINSNKHSNNNNHHHHSAKSSSSSSSKPSIPVDTFASTLAALPTNEQIELFQKHFLSNMFPLAFANQATALSAKSTHQQQQQALAASLPAMAASLMRQGNPAQYLLDMIPQAAKQQQQQQRHHHRHSK